MTELRTIAGKPVLRFERRLAHGPERVWRAVTDPAELAHWFPARVETEARVGAPIRFVFPDEAPVDDGGSGEVLEFDPPKVFVFSWNLDVLRFELVPDGDGCLLVFTQTIGGGDIGRLSGGRNAIGWNACLDGLTARLDGAEPPPAPDWLTGMERYIDQFGLGDGSAHETAEGYELRFARDLVWKPAAEVWRLLTEDESEPGGPAPLPATNGYVPAGRVITASAPHVLEYEWLHDGAPAGRIRWEVVADPELGTRIELTQTMPFALKHLRAEALAAWHTHLELFFAATFGDVRCPWPEERTSYLAKKYAEQLKD
ncbi:SRPBCC family protein [Amycolatopsis endophytica]|uniref:Uncharacterized protein YndB with AHSA1/START domain n=1 Tax=Amycolatopsis endophytica TaxID=860233 RepID=A0A853AXZ7_9PSEU|nr:SRPBCC family protein [Amycolatopsis endophytica]NYI87588.1 uncharacterized protein YndB with AHSA1/START domain [Amycolatopsis endophytica]